MKKVVLDMDGTIVDLYGVKDWLTRLRMCDPTPYQEAEPLVDMYCLRKAIEYLQHRNYKIGVVSWGALGADNGYLEKIRREKRKWIKKYRLPLDFFYCVPYGLAKHEIVNPYGNYLIDDDKRILSGWQQHGGVGVEAENILSFMFSL